MKTNLELLPLDPSRYQGISKTAFALLCRVAFLAKGTKMPITYSTDVGMSEFQLKERSIKGYFSQLEQVGYIYRNSAGGNIQRTVALTFDAVLTTNTAQSNVTSNSIPKISWYEHLNNCGYRTPQFVLRPNAPYLTYEKEPLLNSFRSDMWHIDLSELMQKSKLNLKPFGKSHSWQFNFEQLKEWLKPTNSNMDEIVEKFPQFDGHSWRASHYIPLVKEFFIMSMAIELTVGLRDCFIRQNEFDPFGSNFLELWPKYQRGLLFSCLDACYQTEHGTYALAMRITSQFSPVDGSILDFAFSCIQDEVIKLLNNQKAAERCFNAFRVSFLEYARKQCYIDSTTTHLQVDPLWLEYVWGPYLDKGLLSYEEPSFIPRLSWPLIQFRSLVGMNYIAKLNYCLDRQSCDKASAVLIRSYMRSPYNEELLKLASSLAPYFPFFNNVPNYLESIRAMEP